ncbi:MAG: PLP-dependent aminotransferase family protein [Clostridia bacterium]|nr:PLP-dependent aminotransferase family protein [Clostridia bacterium]
MKYRVEKKADKPAYLQLYRQMRDDVVAGVFRYGDKLPSKRLLAEEAAVSVVTVEHAYAMLAEEGYIEPRERSGYVVVFRTEDGFTGEGEREALPLVRETTVSPSAFPFSLYAKTMRRVISDYGERLLERSPNAGCVELRRAIARYLGRSQGINVAEDQIVIGAGSEYLYTLIVELLGRERVYAIENPSYQRIEQVYRAAGLTPLRLPLGADGIESAALRAAKADVLHISPYRSFPSGVTASASKRHEYLRWGEQDERVLVEDDFESEFALTDKPAETLFSHTRRDNVIYLNTFSKTVSPALRVGYMVLPRRLCETFEQKLGFYSCTVATFEQLVLSELLNGGDFERHIHRVRRRLRKESSEGRADE